MSGSMDDGMAMLCIAGFGDNAGMYDPLVAVAGDSRCELLPLDLPGFGAPPLTTTSLATLADHVLDTCLRERISTIIAHSVASVIATLAAERSDGRIRNIVSLEGNLVAADAYFSGTAADYADAASFRRAFLSRLDELAIGDPVLAGFRARVEVADPDALWALGKDARSFSEHEHPGERLRGSARVTYVYEPANCAPESLAWLAGSGMESVRLPGASHWASVDRPDELLQVIVAAVGG